MLNKITLAAAILAASFSYSYAADHGNTDWSGVYVGGTFSFGTGESRISNNSGTTTGDFDIDGFGAGVALGYNRTAGNIVYGVETDFTLSEIDGLTANNCGGNCTAEIDWLWTLRGRIGYNANRFMPYITGGLAVGDAEASVPGLASNSDVIAGWTLGAGVEFLLNNNWTVKGEYLFVDLGDMGIPGPPPIRAKFDEIHTFRLGINYKFRYQPSRVPDAHVFCQTINSNNDLMV